MTSGGGKKYQRRKKPVLFARVSEHMYEQVARAAADKRWTLNRWVTAAVTKALARQLGLEENDVDVAHSSCTERRTIRENNDGN